MPGARLMKEPFRRPHPGRDAPISPHPTHCCFAARALCGASPRSTPPDAHQSTPKSGWPGPQTHLRVLCLLPVTSTLRPHQHFKSAWASAKNPPRQTDNPNKRSRKNMSEEPFGQLSKIDNCCLFTQNALRAKTKCLSRLYSYWL